MKHASLLVVILLSGQFAKADCRDAYSNEIKRLDGMLNPARVGLATSGATAIAVPVTLAAVGTAVAPAAIIAAPAAVFAAGVFYSAVEIRKAVLMKSLLLIKQSTTGKGKVLERTTKRLQKFNPEISVNDVATQVQLMNNENPSPLCAENDMGKPKLLGIVTLQHKLKKIFLGNMNQTASNEEMFESENEISELTELEAL